MDEDLYMVVIGDEELPMEIHADNYNEVWTNKIKVKVRVLLADD